MPGSLNATVVAGLQISRVALRVGVRADCGYATGGWVDASKRLQGIDCSTEIVLVVAGVGTRMNIGHGVGVIGFSSGCFPCFRCARSLLAGSVFFCETLLAGFALPVVVAHSSSVDDQSAPELSEHGPRRNNGDLSRTIRVGQYLLMDQIVFLRLRSNDLE